MRRCRSPSRSSVPPMIACPGGSWARSMRSAVLVARERVVEACAAMRSTSPCCARSVTVRTCSPPSCARHDRAALRRRSASASGKCPVSCWMLPSVESSGPSFDRLAAVCGAIDDDRVAREPLRFVVVAGDELEHREPRFGVRGLRIVGTMRRAQPRRRRRESASRRCSMSPVA